MSVARRPIPKKEINFVGREIILDTSFIHTFLSMCEVGNFQLETFALRNVFARFLTGCPAHYKSICLPMYFLSKTPASVFRPTNHNH